MLIVFLYYFHMPFSSSYLLENCYAALKFNSQNLKYIEALLLQFRHS